MQPKKGFVIVMSIIRYGVENAADFGTLQNHLFPDSKLSSYIFQGWRIKKTYGGHTLFNGYDEKYFATRKYYTFFVVFLP